ncbi:sensor histidine kinase [Sphingobacterium ginsenosidimutans]|uniref:Signal transduction histidine kinase internal region domain-containing protein n=2 Tax=Sphingobacterium TaxID=28453 RepID=A0ABP7ZXV8_9SPHI
MRIQAYLNWFINKKYTYYFLFILIHIGFMLLNRKLYAADDDWVPFVPIFFVHFCLMVAITLVNGFLLFPWFERTKRGFAYLTAVLFSILVYVTIIVLTEYYQLIEKLPHFATTDYKQLAWSSFLDALWFVVVSCMISITQTRYEKDQQLKNFQIAQLDSELNYLRSQINPHFLFNGLNTVYGLIDRHNGTARDALVQFADLLRYGLYEANADTVDLAKEISYLKSYMEIQQMRKNELSTVELTVDVTDEGKRIVPLLFLPFVENAFKFSGYTNEKESFVKILLRQKENKLLFECENSYGPSVQETGGIGLENVRRRLQLLYPAAHTLQIENDAAIWSVKLNIMI